MEKSVRAAFIPAEGEQNVKWFITIAEAMNFVTGKGKGIDDRWSVVCEHVGLGGRYDEYGKPTVWAATEPE